MLFRSRSHLCKTSSIFSSWNIRRRRECYSLYRGRKRKKDPLIRETDIEDFLKGGKLKRRNYKKRLPPSETLSLARKHLSNNSYSLTLNNCEHFATYCATGKRKSKQLRKAVGGLVGITLAITGTIIRIRRAKREMG